MSEPGPTQDALTTWSGLAPAWEQHRDRVFTIFRAASEWLVDRIDPQPGQTILELAAGPGETGFLAAERVGPTGRLISTDLAPAMVETARRGARARGLENVECRVMDAQRIELPDASVDAVLSRLGVMLAPDPGQVFSEARRVLRRRGRLGYAVMGPPDRNPSLSLLMDALVRNGHPLPGDLYRPGGVFSLSAPERNRELLAGAGLSHVCIEEISGLMSFDSLDDYWALLTGITPLAPLIASLPAGAADSVRTALEPSLASFRSTGGAYEIPWLLVASTATRDPD